MTAVETTDVQQARQHFEKARTRVIEVTTGLTDAQWKFKPAPDRWSIAETLEHMVIVRELVFEGRLAKLAEAPAAPPDRDHRLIDRITIEKIPDRSTRVKAPDFIEPTGQMNPQDALQRLLQNCERLSEFVRSTAGLREHVMDSPPLKIVTNGAYDTMDGYQRALALASHDLRHVEQMLEVKADPNYPA